MYIIHNGLVVTEEGIFDSLAVVVEGSYIHAIIDVTQMSEYPEATLMDAEGGYITPGFIDIHSDYIETIASPRPSSMIDFNISLREAEKILVNNGITTMFHSLSFYKDDIFQQNLMREPDNVREMVDLIDEKSDDLHLIRHRLHARFEIDNVTGVDQLIKNIEENKVHLVSFMDHTPGQGQYRNLENYSDTLRGYRDVTDTEVATIIRDKQQETTITLEDIEKITKLATEKQIAVASHDDDRIEKLHTVKSFGATISEFPITLEVAKEAKKLGLHTIVGAPNVLLGKSHSGNLSAVEAIEHGCADILCSDYYPVALLHAVFDLHEKYGFDLHEMFQKLTLNPAKAVRMDDEIGSLKQGKKADILIIEKMKDGYPMITTTMVDGVVITETNYRI